MIKDSGNAGATNAITLSANGEDQLHGSGTRATNANKAFIQIVSNGGDPGQWLWIARNGFP